MPFFKTGRYPLRKSLVVIREFFEGPNFLYAKMKGRFLPKLRTICRKSLYWKLLQLSMSIVIPRIFTTYFSFPLLLSLIWSAHCFGPPKIVNFICIFILFCTLTTTKFFNFIGGKFFLHHSQKITSFKGRNVSIVLNNTRIGI